VLQIKIGVQLASLRLPLKKALLTAAQMGADAVEIDLRTELRPEELSRTGIRQVRKMLDDLNLRVSCASFRTRRGYDVADDLDRRVEATQEALRVAYDLGTNVVVNHVGRVPAEGEQAAWDTMRQALTDIGRTGQRVGATLAAETGTESGEELLRLIRALPAGSLGVDLHPANLILHGFSPLEAAQALAEHVLHVHATDATRDLAQGRGIEVPLGRGNAELPELLATLEEHHYQGYITIERRQSDNPIYEISQAVQFLRNL
jgi:sugar phosphate isomerase/epimerase